MVLFYLTVNSLDIATGILWWLTKNTVTGVYYTGKYFIYGPEQEVINISREEYEINIQKQMKELSKKLDLIAGKK